MDEGPSSGPGETRDGPRAATTVEALTVCLRIRLAAL
jgi:hypothetical protein